MRKGSGKWKGRMHKRQFGYDRRGLGGQTSQRPYRLSRVSVVLARWDSAFSSGSACIIYLSLQCTPIILMSNGTRVVRLCQNGTYKFYRPIDQDAIEEAGVGINDQGQQGKGSAKHGRQGRQEAQRGST
jgi:hypothetical protein